MITIRHTMICGRAGICRALIGFAIFALAGLVSGAAHANSAPQVSSVRAIPYGPVAGQKVLVKFNLADADGDQLRVRLELYDNNGSTILLQCADTDPEPGAVFAVGADRTIIWDAQTEFPDNAGSEYVLRVVADDGHSATPEDFVLVAAGTFIMGTPADELFVGYPDDTHQVTLTHSFYIQATEVTNEQYVEMAQWAWDNGYLGARSGQWLVDVDSDDELLRMGEGTDIAFFFGTLSCTNPDHPVKYVTWYGAASYCDWLNLRQGLPQAYDHSTWLCNGGDPYAALGYRLPTEAEWEDACRAGTSTAFVNGPITNLLCDDPNLNLVGWYCGNAGSWTHPVALKQPNYWGIYDMHGNVEEWCNDVYAPYDGDATDPVGPGIGESRVIRGGWWQGPAEYSRSGYRGDPYIYMGASSQGTGFRTVKSVD